MNIVLPDDLEQKFRKSVFEKKGMKKGNISEALEEAIQAWLEDEPNKETIKNE
ncbi:MAG: hypothetical protein H0X03_01940 [Nitrosopumilus sp.]|nr:hypothetical protein [Nitrosopumilus sp.]